MHDMCNQAASVVENRLSAAIHNAQKESLKSTMDASAHWNKGLGELERRIQSTARDCQQLQGKVDHDISTCQSLFSSQMSVLRTDLAEFDRKLNQGPRFSQLMAQIPAPSHGSEELSQKSSSSQASAVSSVASSDVTNSLIVSVKQVVGATEQLRSLWIKLIPKIIVFSTHSNSNFVS